jgi:hypothetical protein
LVSISVSCAIGHADHREIGRDRAHDLDPELPERRFALRQHAIDPTAASHGSAAPAGCAASSRKWLVISAARRTSPCNNERAGSFGIEWIPVQQIGQATDRGETIVQGVENVRRAIIEHNVFDG